MSEVISPITLSSQNEDGITLTKLVFIILGCLIGPILILLVLYWIKFSYQHADEEIKKLTE